MVLTRLEPRHWWGAAGLALVLTVLGGWMMVPGVAGVFHDDGIYLATAKSLAEGEGYRLINLPHAPHQTKYPILYPALLAIVWKAWPSFPDNLIAMQWLTLLAGATAVGLAGLYLIRFAYFGYGTVLAAGLLTVTTSLYVFYNVITMSESVFLLLSVLAMWRLEKELENPGGNVCQEMVLGCMLAMPMLCRTIGGIFIPIGLLLLFRSGRRLRAVLGAVALTAGPWVAWTILIPRWDHDVIAIYYTNYMQWWQELSLASIVRILSFNALYIIQNAGTLYQSLLVELTRILAIYSWAVVVPLGFITLFALGKRLRSCRVLPCFLAGYLFVICLWPWHPQRFIMPILPFLLAYFLNEVWQAPPFRLAPTVWRQGLRVGLAMLLIVNLSFSFAVGRAWGISSYPYPLHVPEPVRWSSYQEVFQWIKSNSQPSDVLCASLDSMVYLHTGRTAFRPYMVRPAALFYFEKSAPLGAPEEFIDIVELYRPRYLVQTAMPGYSEEQPLNELIDKVRIIRPGWLKPVFIGTDRRFAIYEFQDFPGGSPGSL